MNDTKPTTQNIIFCNPHTNKSYLYPFNEKGLYQIADDCDICLYLYKGKAIKINKLWDSGEYLKAFRHCADGTDIKFVALTDTKEPLIDIMPLTIHEISKFFKKLYWRDYAWDRYFYRHKHNIVNIVWGGDFYDDIELTSTVRECENFLLHPYYYLIKRAVDLYLTSDD